MSIGFAHGAHALITAEEFSDVTDAFFAAEAEGRHERSAGISVQRCIDWLLDLYQATTSEELRLLIGEVIEDIDMLASMAGSPSVDGELEDGELEDMVLGAMASVEAAVELVEGRS